MTSAVDQHEAFHAGLEKFRNYLQERRPEFSSAELIAIMDSFSQHLHIHPTEEPPTIADLARFNTPATPIDSCSSRQEASELIIPLQHPPCSLLEHGKRRVGEWLVAQFMPAC
ncbi:rRNA-processing protein bfr2 [Clarireedia jacksonii]